MEWYLLFSILLGGLIGLMILGIPVFLSFVIINLVGIYFLWGWNGILNYSHTLFFIDSQLRVFPNTYVYIDGGYNSEVRCLCEGH